jgi:predicted nucleic acid-binding protein
MNIVFLDTAGFLALWDEEDQWHTSAEAAFALLVRQPDRLITSNLILLECGNAAARRPYRSAVDDLGIEMEAKGPVILPTDKDLTVAWQACRRGEAAQAGIVDLVSFSMMRPLRITRAFTNVRRFRAAGFEALF